MLAVNVLVEDVGAGWWRGAAELFGGEDEDCYNQRGQDGQFRHAEAILVGFRATLETEEKLKGEYL